MLELKVAYPNRLIRVLSILMLCMLGGACSSLSYYHQAISGQMELLQKSRPISQVIDDPATNEKLRRRLLMMRSAREFATRELLLPNNDSYQDYADLGRPYALWNVFVVPEFSLQPMQWCYPFVGCIGYRNYFSPVDARAYATQMQAQGYDVYVAGVPAYSTLGWFDDPLMNTMMHWQDYDLVGTLFHELAHQQFYAPGDTVFNESLARAIESEGLRRWMAQQQNSEDYQRYLRDTRRERQFVELVLATRTKLRALYQTKRPHEDMFVTKLELFRQLRRDYLSLRQQWDGYEGYDRWMLSGVNNAKVQSIATYHDYLPAFRRMLVQEGGDLAAFYRRIRQLIDMGQEARESYLQQLLID